jgi:Fe-S-cluster-containing dehydrogenase component
MAKYGMVIDVSRCIACYCCFAACKDEYWENDYPPYSAGQPRFGQFWINPIKKERGTFPCIKVAYIPHLCQHCDNAPCIKASKGAIVKRADGIVLIDPVKSKGQKQIVDSCPYKVIFWNEEKQIPQACTFCVHRVTEKKMPRCAQICPSEAIKFGDLSDPKSEVAQLLASGKAETLNPDQDTDPRVHYINLPKIFIAGSVAYSEKNDCIEGATVTLSSTSKSDKTTTNAFGDFIFDGLSTSKYSLKIDIDGYVSQSIDVDLSADKYLGVIKLTKS